MRHEIRSVAGVTDPPVRVWTHLAGVYDKAGKKIQLFVNGRPQGSPVALPDTVLPVPTNGGLQVGRASNSSGGFGEYLAGLVDEVQVWQRALAEGELREEAQLFDADHAAATALLAQWDASGASGSSILDTSGHGRSAMTLSSGAAIDVEGEVLTLDGRTGSATATGPVIDETGSFTVTAKVQLNAAELANKPVGYIAQVVGQRTAGESSWAIWYRHDRADDGTPAGNWFFGRAGVDASGTVKQVTSVPSASSAELDTFVQLTGVYDAEQDRLRG